jgi:hypothetical protein
MKFNLFLLLLATLLAIGSSQEFFFQIQLAESDKFWDVNNKNEIHLNDGLGTWWNVTTGDVGYRISPYNNYEYAVTYVGTDKTLILKKTDLSKPTPGDQVWIVGGTNGAGIKPRVKLSFQSAIVPADYAVDDVMGNIQAKRGLTAKNPRWYAQNAFATHAPSRP